MGVAQPALICAVFIGLLTPTPATPVIEENQLQRLQDVASFMDYVQSKGLTRFDIPGRKTLGFRRNQDLVRSNLNDLSPSDYDSSDETMSMNKRGYRTLCHFKICNMG